MNNSSLLNTEEFYGERMTSITIDVDEDESNKIKQENINNNIQLKSILKKNFEYSDEERLIMLSIKKLCYSVLIIIICIPIIFCDIYYGLIDTYCVNKTPSYLNISLKLYLLLSGFINLTLAITLIITIIYIKEFGNKRDIAYTFTVCNLFVMNIFNLVWNLIGAFIFWGYFYNKEICKIELSTYVFISLLIKLLFNFLSIYYKNY